MTLKLSAVLILAGTLGGMQFFGPKCLNPVTQPRDEVQADPDVPPAITNLFERSCMDCHSNHTQWRWYSHIAPVSWYIHNHIDEGRKKMNFSEWSSRRDSSGRVIHSINDLEDVCDVVSKGTMPFRSYTLLHPNAVLSADEKKAVCDWTDKLESERHAQVQPVGDPK